MPKYLRNRVPGGTYFFTVNLLERKSALLIEHITALREAVRIVREKQPFHIDAWVVLPNHMHSIWTLPPGDDSYSARWQAIKKAFTMDYVHYNPVKHGWARTVTEWPYSSFFLWSRWAFIHRIGQVWIWRRLKRVKGKFKVFDRRMALRLSALRPRVPFPTIAGKPKLSPPLRSRLPSC